MSFFGFITAIAFAINLGGVIAGALVFREVVADFIRPMRFSRRAHRCPHLECWSCTYDTTAEVARHLHAQHSDEAVFALPKDGGPVRWEIA